MFGTLFGAEMPLTVRFFLAFLIVLGLIGVTAWAVRRFGSGRLGGVSARGRQPRLAVIDHASVDARRRLILVRRDNVEHLLMIGGPTDVVVESNIVRAAPAAREVTLPRPPAAETLTRAIPLPETGPSSSWPLQPESAGPVRQPRIEPAAEEPMLRTPPSEPTPRPPREPLAAFADEIASRPPPLPPRPRAGAAARAQASEPRAAPRVATAPPADTESAADQSLAEMAHRLEAALRKPKTIPEVRDARGSATTARPATPPEHAAEPEAAPPSPGARADAAPARAAEAKPAPTDAKVSQGKALYDSLEREMASLLGRQAGKT